MAYYLNYKAEYENRITNRVRLELYKKDSVASVVPQLTLKASALSYPKNENGKFDNIISCELRFTLFLKSTDSPTFLDFIVTYKDEWLVKYYVDDVLNFTGFLVPGLGTVEFKDKPHQLDLTATDGLGLLKGVVLTDNLDENFTGVNLQVDYLRAILNKTDLGLNIRVYSSIVEESMTDRTEAPESDTLNQSALHARSFLKDPITFYDCYKCLQIILEEGFALYQWMGKWVIRCNVELQTNIGLKNSYTEYDSEGVIVEAAQDGIGPAEVGRDKVLEPINISGKLSSRFAVKSVKTGWDYVVWPELPTNNKFERATVFESGDYFDEDDLDGDGDTSELVGTYTKATIDSWTYGKFLNNPTQITNLPALDPTTDIAYRRIIKDQAGNELVREVILENNLDDQHRLLICEAVPCIKGDKFSVTFDAKRTGGSSDGTFDYLCIFVKGASANRWNLLSQDSTLPDGGPLVWEDTNLVNPLRRFYDNGEVITEYVGYNIQPPPIPENGELFICFRNTDSNGTKQYYRNFKFEYFPFIAGGYIQVDGDYWFTEQDLPLQDIIEKKVGISDSIRKLLKGAIYRENLTDLTTTTWHRLGVDESRHYKELINLARFNNEYRRFWQLDATCKGTTFSPQDDSTTIEPLGFHRHFYFPRSSELANRYFILMPPLRIDHGTGRIDATFVETLNASDVLDGGLTPEQIVNHLVSQFGLTVGDNNMSFTGSDGGSGGTNWTFTIDGNILEGTNFKLVMNISGTGVVIITDYTALAGDDENDVAAGIYANIFGGYGSSQGGNQFIINTPAGSSIVQMIITPGYNLQVLAGDLSGDPRYFRVYCGPSDTVTVETDDGGAGNSPTITVISNTLITSTQRLYIFKVEDDIDGGNVFTVHIHLANGTIITESFTATDVFTYADGNQDGDTHEFKYIFQ